MANPAHFAREHRAASWSYLCGEDFAAMDGGTSYADVEAAVDVSADVVSGPPRILDVDLARRQVAALDDLPRPTLVTCRTGARSSALSCLYEGLRSGESAEQVLERAESDGAPFVRSAECGSGSSRVCASCRRAAAGARERMELERDRRHDASVRLAG